jgi:putative spermidine/putrescine transport system permease protein
VLLLAPPLGWFVADLPRGARALSSPAFWSVNRSPASSSTIWTLDNFARSVQSRAPYRTIALRTIGIAAAVTVTDALLAFPFAYFMARSRPAAAQAALFVPCCCRSGRATWCASTRGG